MQTLNMSKIRRIWVGILFDLTKMAKTQHFFFTFDNKNVKILTELERTGFISSRMKSVYTAMFAKCERKRFRLSNGSAKIMLIGESLDEKTARRSSVG